MSEKIDTYKKIMSTLQICAHNYQMNLHNLSRLIQSFSTRQHLSVVHKISKSMELYTITDPNFKKPSQEVDMNDFFAKVERIFSGSDNNVRKGFLEVFSEIEEMALDEEKEIRLRQKYPDLQKIFDEYQVALKLYRDH